jgi:hypothetical protein
MYCFSPFLSFVRAILIMIIDLLSNHVILMGIKLLSIQLSRFGLRIYIIVPVAIIIALAT